MNDARVKASNPKDSLGSLKVPMSTIPLPVILEIGVGMFEGACKYSRHNYREIGVRASVYFDAVVARHLTGWWEGEDEDPDTCAKDDSGKPIPGTGLSHLSKAMAGLVVLRDSQLMGNMVDDRPPPGVNGDIGGHIKRLNDMTARIAKMYPDAKYPYTANDIYGLRE